MHLWALGPRDVSTADWEASTFKGEVVVRAETEQQARMLAARAFGVAAIAARGERAKVVPWESGQLVTCERTGSAEGLTEDGEVGVVYPESAVELARDGYADQAFPAGGEPSVDRPAKNEARSVPWPDFGELDLDGDGRVTPQEYRQALSVASQPARQPQAQSSEAALAPSEPTAADAGGPKR